LFYRVDILTRQGRKTRGSLYKYDVDEDAQSDTSDENWDAVMELDFAGMMSQQRFGLIMITWTWMDTHVADQL
jgi:hypothetical protein